MPNGFADAFLESVFKTRAENAERQRFNAQLQFEQAKTFQQQQIERERLANEKQYQAALIKDAQDRSAEQTRQFNTTFGANQANKAFELQSQGLATPVNPIMNLLGTGAPLQPPAPGMEPAPLGVPAPEMSDLPVTQQQRQGAVAQAPPGAQQFGAQFLQPRTVEERLASEQATKLRLEHEAKVADQSDFLKFLNDPENKFTDEQKQKASLFYNMKAHGVSAAEAQAIFGKPEGAAKSPTLDDYVERMTTGHSTNFPNMTAEMAKAGYLALKPPKAGNESATLNRNYRGFHDAQTELDKIGKPVGDQTELLGRALKVIDANNAALDPLVLPAVNALFSRRQSEAELKRIGLGRSTYEGAQVAWKQLFTGGSISDTQRQQLHDMAVSMQKDLSKRQAALKKAYQDIDPDENPKYNSNVIKTLRDAWGDETPTDQGDQGGGMGLDVTKIRSILDKKK